MIKKSKKQFIYYFPILFILAIVPLIVFMKVDKLTGAKFDFWTGVDVHYDFFSYYKSILLVVSSLLAIVFFLLKRTKEQSRIKRTNYYIPFIIYFVFILLSTLFSGYKTISLFGYMDRYEGAFVLISYLIILFVANNLINTKEDLVIVIKALSFSTLIITLIGIFQFIGLDLFQSQIGKTLILPTKYHSLIDEITIHLNKGSTIYSTLYNPNYVGSFAALVLPIFLVVFLYTKKRFFKYASGVLSLFILINLLGSGSRAGIIGSVVSILLLFALLRKLILKSIIPFLLLITIFILSLIGMNIVSNGDLLTKISTLNLGTESEMFYQKKGTVILDDIILNKDSIEILTSDQNLILDVTNNILHALDNNHQKLPVYYDKTLNKIKIQDNSYSNYELEIFDKGKYIKIHIDKKEAMFFHGENGFQIIGYQGKPRNIIRPEHFGFENNQTFASSRGYIWSRTIPMLKNTILIGHGPDTFAIYFPQDDYIGKLNIFNNTNWIVDKPHNMYFGIAMNTGVISLISLLLVFAYYILSSIKIFLFKRDLLFEDIIGAGILSGIIGYLIVGIFNDSTVSVAPIFWILLGIGIRIQINNRKSPIPE